MIFVSKPFFLIFKFKYGLPLRNASGLIFFLTFYFSLHCILGGAHPWYFINITVFSLKQEIGTTEPRKQSYEDLEIGELNPPE